MFSKLLLLDLNTLGLITDFINNDFNYLNFLNENKVKPYYKDINWNYINWEEISNNIENYEPEILDKYKDKFNWTVLTSKNIDNQGFLTKYSDFIDFKTINEKMRFSYTIEYNFYEQFQDKLDWIKLSRWADMAEDFIDRFHNKLDWGILCRTQGLTEYILNKYYDKLNIEDIRYNYHIDTELRNEIVDRMNLDEIEEELENEENNEDIEENEDIIIEENNEDIIIEENNEDIQMEENNNEDIQMEEIVIIDRASEEDDEDSNLNIIENVNNLF